MPIRCRRLLLAALTLGVTVTGAPLAHANAPQPGLNAEYFDYTDLSGSLAQRIDQQVNFNWHQTEPVPGTGEDFSVRWTGVVTPPHSGPYTFYTLADDGVRLWIDGALVIDDWTLHSAADRSGGITLQAGTAYDLKLEYFDGLRHAQVRLDWKSAGHPREVVPASAFATARPAQTPPVVVPQNDGVSAVVMPAASPSEPMVPVIIPDSLLPVPDAPAIVSSGGPLAPPAPPVAGETFNAAPEGGEVLVRRPADGQLIALDEGASLPVGTHVDVREGGVDIQTAPADGVERPTQDAHFEGGMFRVGQSRNKGKVVTIDLLHGEFKEACGPLSRAERRAMTRKHRNGAIARAAATSRVLRRLWGKGKGRFRTRGRHAAATVRGTSWSIADRCDETSVRVHEGVVDVEDLITGRTVTLTGGERYSARP